MRFSVISPFSKKRQHGDHHWRGCTGAQARKPVHGLRQYQQRVQQDHISDADRKIAMNRVNPKYVLRNYLAQQAIDKAEQNDFSEVWKLLEIMRKPYDEQPEYDDYAGKRPDWARQKPGCSMLSCSS